LAPEQAVIVNITDAQGEYAKEMTQSLQDKGFRVTSDLRNEKIGFKIREHSMSRVPYLLIVGEKEKESRTLAIRSREGEDLGNMSLAQVIELLSEGIARLGRNFAKTE
jgi:threonyl-tRNA synthetase